MADKDRHDRKEAQGQEHNAGPVSGGKEKKWTPQEVAAKRREQMKEITDRLESGLKEYMATDTQFKKVLETMAKFHHYSANNILLIAMQMPSATHVASYGAWQKKFHRQVRRGQKGISIIIPAPYKKKTEREVTDPRTGAPVRDAGGNPVMEEVEVTVPHFKVAKVFDLAQTYGEPLPELDVPELTGTAENYQVFMDAVKSVSPVPVRFDEIEGNAKGYYDGINKEIVIQSRMSEVQTMKTAVHELAHARIHDREVMEAEGALKTRETREIEAEAIAHVLLAHYQLDSSDYSLPYLASWCSSLDTSALRASMDTIRRTASAIFDEIEAYIAEQDLDRYTIYQIEDNTPASDYRFMDLDFVKRQAIPLSMEYYQDVYRGYLRPGDTLEGLYEKFNRDDRPAADRMHSLSMSDVVVLHKSGEDHAFYVDDIGFAEVPEFFLSAAEQDRTGQDISRNDSREEAEKAPLSFYVAECMEYPLMGEFHKCSTLKEAAEIYQTISSDQMHGGKGIGISLQDGSEYAGDFPLFSGGHVLEDEINNIAHYRDLPSVQEAIRQAKDLFPDQQPVIPAGREEQKEAAHDQRPDPGSRKASVLAALRRHKQELETGDRKPADKVRTAHRQKGEPTL